MANLKLRLVDVFLIFSNKAYEQSKSWLQGLFFIHPKYEQHCKKAFLCFMGSTKVLMSLDICTVLHSPVNLHFDLKLIPSEAVFA